MKDQKVFLLGLGFDGSQETQLWDLRKERCTDPCWEYGLVLPPLLVLRVMNSLPTKEQIFSLLATSGDWVKAESFESYSSSPSSWFTFGASLSKGSSWANFDRILGEIPDSCLSNSSGPWDELASFFGCPYLCLGFGDSRLGSFNDTIEKTITLTRPSLRIYQIHSWEQSGRLWYENLSWTLGFERRLRLPKSRKSF